MSPKVGKLVCRPTLTSAGWLSRCSVAGTAFEEEDEDKVEEEFVPLVGFRGRWRLLRASRAQPSLGLQKNIQQRRRRRPYFM